MTKFVYWLGDEIRIRNPISYTNFVYGFMDFVYEMGISYTKSQFVVEFRLRFRLEIFVDELFVGGG
jgi:hypothetical protein